MSKKASPKGGRPQKAAFQWPIANSKTQAAEILGWPVTRLTELKKVGAPGFDHGRVRLAELIPWLGHRGLEEGDVDWSGRLRRAQAKREEFRLAADEKRVIDRAGVETCLRTALHALWAQLEQILCNELPPVLAGQDAPTIARRCGEALERSKEVCRERVRNLEQ